MEILEPWNNSSVLPPPVHTSICDTDTDIKHLTYTCNSIIGVLSKQSPLHMEGAIFSRFLYKFDKKFRNDIGYRYFKKVNTALRRYLTLNMLKIVEDFVSVLPENDDLYLPTRQMLEYVLVRLMTFSKLMLRICKCSKQAAVFYLDRVKRGESHWMSFMPYSILSRVWSMSKVLLQHSCSWYSNLYPFLEKLKLKGLHFLPVDYQLPFNLEEWLEIKYIENFGRFEWSQKKQLEIDTGFVEDETDKFDSILQYVNQINSDETSDEKLEHLDTSKINKEIKVVADKNVDKGEVISRHSFKRLLNNVQISEPKIKHSIERVTNKDSLQQFITIEEDLRNENSDQSLTSHLSFMQWQALKNSLQKLYESLANNRKIEKKFQKIWKEKCIDT